MKTLDEVVDCAEKWTADFDEDSLERQMIFYLQLFRDHQQRLEKLCDNYGDAIVACEQAENKYRKMEEELNGIRREFVEQMKNDPLTCDELREMVNKPVWIEEYYPVMEDETGATEDEGQYEKHWAIVRETSGKKIWILGPNINYGLGRMSYGVTWQAYRKERNDAEI